jgi:hypothetical protein
VEVTAAALLVTGGQRSGTTLLEKLLGVQDQISLLSQPFPLLYAEVKRAFLRDNDPYPLGHLFLESRYEPRAFAEFLSGWHPTRADLATLFERMQSYSGQYTKFTPRQLDRAFSRVSPDADFADVVSELDRVLTDKPSAVWFGSKEIVCEEYVPTLLDRGFRCVIILRDPRDVIASLNHGRGRDFGGELKPTLFNVRSWRKSVALAMAVEDHPRFHWCRYEDLAADPAGELARLAEALGLGSFDRTHVSASVHDSSGEPWRGNSSHHEHDGITTSSVGTYRQILPAEVAELIEAASLPEMRLLGYETTMTRARAPRVLERFCEPYSITRTGLERDFATIENAAIEVERLDRVSTPADEQSARWFLFTRTHSRLREALLGTAETALLHRSQPAE